MKHWKFWASRLMGGLAALALFTHCGAMETEERAAQEARSRAPSALQQEVSITQIFTASADAAVLEWYPTDNFGTGSRLLADQSPLSMTYLRFNVSGVKGRVTRAVLRLYVFDETSNGPQVYAVKSAWTETGITWNNRPPLDTVVLGDVGAISTSSWIEYDLTGFIHGDAEYNLALSAASPNGADFASREFTETEEGPQLILTVEAEPLPASCLPRTASRRLSVTPLDGYASQSQPTARLGGTRQLLVDEEPSRYETFLQAQVRPPSSGWFTREVKLRLYATDPTSNGPVLYRTHDWWDRDFNWYSRPLPSGNPVGNAGAISANTWVEYDVSSWVTVGGTYGFALLPESSNGVDFVSRESASEHLRPQLSILQETLPYCAYQGVGGTLGWARHYGGLGPEWMHALASGSDGGFVAAGQFGNEPFPQGQGFALARYTPEGLHLWTRRITTGRAEVDALAITPAGDILAVGSYYGTVDLGTGPLPHAVTGWSRALFIAKFSADGEPMWAQGFAASYVRGGQQEPWPVYPGGLTTDAQGNLIVTGAFHGIMDLGGGPLFAGEPSVYESYESFSGGFLAKFSREGQHLWSRVFRNTDHQPVAGSAVAIDTAGNLLVGGAASSGSDLGDGLLGEYAPFIARYDASGTLLWKRLFPGLKGQVVSLEPLEGDAMAFIGQFEGTFTFAGQTYTGGNPDSPPAVRGSSFVGTLSTTQGDGWLRKLGDDFSTIAWRLATDDEGTLTITGQGGEMELGGGTLGTHAVQSPFVARYSRTGSHLWSRVLDSNFEDDRIYPFRAPLHLALQPGGRVLLGGTFSSQLVLDGTAFSSHGGGDLFYLRLQP